MFSGLVIAWRRAIWPTSTSPLSSQATTEGVSRPPSSFARTVGSLPSMMATTELVVPRSIPMILPMSWFSFFRCRFGGLASDFAVTVNTPDLTSSKSANEGGRADRVEGGRAMLANSSRGVWDPSVPLYTEQMFHPVVQTLAGAEVRRADAGAGPGLAADRVGQGRSGHRADRLGQDAGGVPLGARPAGRRGHRGRRHPPRPDQRSLRVAAQGAVERRAPEPRGAARRNQGAGRRARAMRRRRSGRRCEPATRPRASGARRPAGRRTSSSPRPSRSTSC